jgi:hypothetical protein
MKRKKIDPQEVARRVACAREGHPRIAKSCFGYVTCARCDAMIGDTLGGAFNLKGYVVVGHRTRESEPCAECIATAKALTRRERTWLPKDVRAEIKLLRGAA